MFITENELSSVGASVHVEADTSYEGAAGAYVMMAEGFANDFNLFTAAVKADAKEARLLKESAGEDEIATVQEGAISSFYEKLKAWVKKIIAKIKGIFTGFIAKMQAWMGRDGKAFFDKYKKDIFGKDVSGLKFRYSKPKSSSPISDASAVAKVGSISNSLPEGKDHSELVEYLLDKICGIKDKASFHKDFHEACFDDEDKSYEAQGTEVKDYLSYISGAKDPVEVAKKAFTAEERALGEFSRMLDKQSNSVIKSVVSDDKTTTDSVGTQFDGKSSTGRDAANLTSLTNNAQERVHKLQKALAAMNEAYSTYNGAFITEIKFGVSQSRRIGAAIVAYRGKKNEDVDMVELAQENAEYDFYSDVEIA